MNTVKERDARRPAATKSKPKPIGWQGFTLDVPEEWDLTGFSGDETSGYLRVDDSEEQGAEIKWVTEPAKAKKAPELDARLETYFGALRRTARKKKIDLTTKEVAPPKSVLRDDRTVKGFQWVGDRKAFGAIWFCQTCKRVVIVQVLGHPSGRGSLGTVANEILGSLRCHGDDPAWRIWALYDLYTEIPATFTLVGQQLMNVYLRLSFAHRAERLSVEQWAIANISRRDEYLDRWLTINSKAELTQARYAAAEGEAQGHPALILSGGLGIGLPWMQVPQQLSRFQVPATRFSAVAWECAESNKVYLVEGFRTFRSGDSVAEVARRTRCHR
ncbi:MAG: hypothetical protein SFU56_14865 [Capsulimonadales bacterium]|nr:hypothetical protein [Capsulimonadales bacterium]